MNPIKCIAIASLLVLAGCAGMAANMTPEQLTAAAKDKSASAFCFQGPGWNGGQASVLYANFDKGTTSNGGGTVECGQAKATFTDAGKPATAAAPAAAKP